MGIKLSRAGWNPGDGYPCIHPGNLLCGISLGRISGGTHQLKRWRRNKREISGWRLLVPGYCCLSGFCLRCICHADPGHFNHVMYNILSSADQVTPIALHCFCHQTRHHLNLAGSPLADFILSFTLWPRLLIIPQCWKRKIILCQRSSPTGQCNSFNGDTG